MEGITSRASPGRVIRGTGAPPRLEGVGKAPIIDLDVAALRDGGFREVGVIWQNMENRVLMAVR
jgi:hypothetical protein